MKNEIGAVRIVPIVNKSLRGDGRTGLYRIEEIVTKDGLYIEWEDHFSSIESAQEFLSKKGYTEIWVSR